MDATENKFYLLMEYGLGGEIDHENLAFVKGQEHNNGGWDEYDTSHVDLSKKLGLCNGFRIWNDPSIERIEHAMKGGYAVLVDIFFHDDRWKIFAKKRGKDAVEYYDSLIKYLADTVKNNPGSVWVNRFAENDNHPWVTWKLNENTRTGIFKKLKEFYNTNEYWMSSPDGEKIINALRPDGDWRDNPFEYLRKKGMKPEDINMVTLYCNLFSPHLLCKLGAKVVWQEGNQGGNHQLSIAFSRGAASQYGRQWFYDIAPFSCQCNAIPLAYDSRRRRFSGFPEEYMLSCWLLTYLSGAKALLFQAGEMMFFIKDKQNKRKLSPLGEIARDFADFTLTKHPDRGEPEVPVALMLAEDHGYASSFYNQSRTFWKKLDNDRSNTAIEGFFRLAFPGCNETNGFSFDTNKWAPDGSSENQNPWWYKAGTKEEHSKAFSECIANGFEQRKMLKAFITPTPWGDSFDVITDNADLKALQAYKAVIMLGNIKINDKNREVLKEYVRNGGRLLVNISSVTTQDEDMLGLELSGTKNGQFYYSYSAKTGRSFNDGFYEYEQVKLRGAEALIYAGRTWEKRNPVVTRNKYGEGEVWFAGIPDFQADNEYDVKWAEPCKEAVDEFIRPLLSVSITGRPVHWTLNRTEQGFIIGLFNNTENHWEGQVRLNHILEIESVRDIWNDKAVPYSYDETGRAVLSSGIAPWEFKIIEIKEICD